MKKTILVTSRAGVINFSIIQYFYQKNYNVIKAMKKKILNQEAKIELLKKKKPLLQSVKKNEVASLIYYLSSSCKPNNRLKYTHRRRMDLSIK